jgi:serine/threonine-protein kinase
MTSHPEEWARIKTLFALAMEREPGERAVFLAQLPEHDAPLRGELASLLAAAEDPDSLPAARAAIASGAGDVALQHMLTDALGSQYEIVRPLGEGGMGAVYLAREVALERFVAVKVLRPDLAHAEESRERFRREARVVAQLSHPSILPLHTFGEVRGTWYFVMGYARGMSLAERLRAEGRLPSEEAHRILTELADALECAHRNGIVHRDIKPANILLDSESGRAVLADFGISKVQGAGENLTATGFVVGTPHFMAPEQAVDREVDARSDIYSLGAVGYTMLAGREPFAGVSAEQVAYRRMSHDPPRLETIAPSVPPELASIVMRCLARDPALRWPSAAALRDALARASGDAFELPEAVRELPMFGPYALIWALIWTWLAARPYRSIGDRGLLLLIAVLVPAGLLMQLRAVAPEGMSRRELARVAFWPPEWWSMWWPRGLRRPRDLWMRLPWPARAVRGLLSAFIVGLPTLILAREWVQAVSGESPLVVERAFARAEWTLVAVAALGALAAVVWSWRRRLSFPDAVRVLIGSTMPDRGWSSPSIACVLVPARGGMRGPAADSPADHARAVIDLAPRLEESDSTLRRDVVGAARALLDAIERCDVEMARLSADASAGELDRLSARIHVLEASSEVGPVSGTSRELLDLLRRQLDLLRRMRLEGELLLRKRERSFSLLRGLWQQSSAMRDAGGDSSDARARIRELLDQIGYRTGHSG